VLCPAGLEVSVTSCDFDKLRHGGFPSEKYIAMLRREALVYLVWSSQFWLEETPQSLWVWTGTPLCLNLYASFERLVGHFCYLGKLALCLYSKFEAWP